MALLFTEGFDSYDDPIPLWYKWNRQTTAPRVAGRTVGGYGINIAAADFAPKTIPESTTLIVGFAIYPTIAGNFEIARVYNKADQAVLIVGMDNDNTIYVEDFSSVVDSTTFSLPLSQWSYIELKISQAIENAPLGSVQVRGTVGPLSIIFYTSPAGRDYNAPGLTTVSTATLEGGAGNHYFDDFYIADTTGTKNNNFIGAIIIKTMFPTGNGSVTQLTPVGAGTNYQAVNNPVLTPDATYVDSRVIGDKDLYRSVGLAVTPGNSIAAVVANAVIRKDKSGYGHVKLPVRFGATDSNGSDYFVPSGYQEVQRVMDVNPIGSIPWNQNDVNNLQAGVMIS